MSRTSPLQWTQDRTQSWQASAHTQCEPCHHSYLVLESHSPFYVSVQAVIKMYLSVTCHMFTTLSCSEGKASQEERVRALPALRPTMKAERMRLDRIGWMLRLCPHSLTCLAPTSRPPPTQLHPAPNGHTQAGWCNQSISGCPQRSSK